jgi:hypothetical protein
MGFSFNIAGNQLIHDGHFITIVIVIFIMITTIIIIQLFVANLAGQAHPATIFHTS